MTENNLTIRAKIARENMQLIQCRICKQKEVVHLHSLCWRKRLCVKCANREVELRV